ncbi:MAG: hypothetical protein AAF727_15755 [Pseudomonadota bacterium]
MTAKTQKTRVKFASVQVHFTISTREVKNLYNKIVSIQHFIPFFSALRMIATREVIRHPLSVAKAAAQKPHVPAGKR